MKGNRSASVLLCALAACASPSTDPGDVRPPGPSTVSLTGPSGANQSVNLMSEVSATAMTLAYAPEDVWDVLPLVFQTLEIEPTTIDSERLVMGARDFRARPIEDKPLSTYLDCGRDMTGPYADSYSVRLTVMVELGPAPAGATSLSTVVDGIARPRATTGNPLPCSSTRTLERRIWELITIILL